MKLDVLPPTDTFNCSQCGNCCSHIRGMMPLGDVEFIKEMAYGKLPIVHLIPVEKMSFPLWDWEADRFLKWKEEVHVDATILPSKGILDLNSNKAIIVNYFIDADSCPFLNQGKCKIYHTNRAYICRLFPFNKTPFLNTGEKIDPKAMFGTCGAMEKIIPKLPGDIDNLVPFLQKTFPSGTFENAVQFDHISEWVNKTIVTLFKQKKLRPAMNYPYQFFMKRFENAEKIHLTDYLEEIGYIESKKELIERFDSNLDAKEMLKKYA